MENKLSADSGDKKVYMLSTNGISADEIVPQEFQRPWRTPTFVKSELRNRQHRTLSGHSIL